MGKRIASLLLCVIMLCAAFSCPTVSAANGDQWQYKFTLKVKNTSGAETKGASVFGYIDFKGAGVDSTQRIYINGNRKDKSIKRGELLTAVGTSNNAPWIIRKVGIKNSCDDALCVEYIKVEVRKNASGSWKEILPKYNPKGSVWEKWIETQKGSGYDTNFGKNPWQQRELSDLDNFSSLGGQLVLDVNTNYSGTSPLEKVWTGKVIDQFGSLIGDSNGRYDSISYSDAPNITLSAYGRALDSDLIIDIGKLKENGLTQVERNGKVVGYKIDRAKLLDYMNKKSINRITLNTTLDFPSSGINTGSYAYRQLNGNSYGDFSRTLVITRNAFALTGIGYYNTTKSVNSDNHYYGQNSGYIEFRARIKTEWDGPNNNHLTQSALSGKTISFTEAKIEIGNTGKYIYASKTSGLVRATLDSWGGFKIRFPLTAGLDSARVGSRITLTGGEITVDGTDYYLCDDETGTGSFTPGSFTEYRVGTSYKIDTKAPTVTLAAVNDAQNGWRKTLQLSVTPSENVSSAEYENEMLFSFARGVSVNGTLSDFIEVYRVGKSGTQDTSGRVSGAANSTSVIEIALKHNIEVEGTIAITGIDIAGNPVKSTLSGIKLDNCAPIVKMETSKGARDELDAQKSKSNKYSFRVSDASGTGRVYYCFTRGADAAPETGTSVAASGIIEETIGRWAYIEDIGGGVDGVALIKCPMGMNFTGRLHYYTEDAFGNRSNITSVDVNIINENTLCDITAVDSDTTRPLKSYNININTESVNSVQWRWYNPRTGSYIADYRDYTSGTETGSGVQLDNQGNDVILDGYRILEVRITAPSGSEAVYRTDFTFDNGNPYISFIVRAPGTYRDTQTVKIMASDASGITEAYARIVNPDGSEIDGFEELPRNLASDGIVSHDITVSGIKSGVYAIRVRAIDFNGFETVMTSNVFHIRTAPPELTASVQSDKTYAGAPLLNSQTYYLDITVNEPFINVADSIYPQYLYYRIADASLQYGDWIGAGEIMAVTADGYTFTSRIEAPVALTEGENNIYIQTVVVPIGMSPDKADINTVTGTGLTVYYDAAAPQYRLELRDTHTSGSVTGRIMLSDNLTGTLYCTSENSSIVITRLDAVSPDDITGELIEENTFSVTVTDNVSSSIRISDAAGNTATVPIVITNIDRTAPAASLSDPVAVTTGARTDYTASLTVTAKQTEEAMFAFIPVSELSGALGADGMIEQRYFNYDQARFAVTLTKETPGVYADESDCEYSIRLSALTGEFCLGVYTEDSVGNRLCRIFEPVFSPVDAYPTLTSYRVSPEKAGSKAILTVEFNLPVAVLPQDKIRSSVADEELTAEEKAAADASGLTRAEWVNLNSIDRYSPSLTQTVSIMITAHGTYRFYITDDVGRAVFTDVTVDASDVSFNNASGVTAQTYLNTVTTTTTLITETVTDTADPSNNGVTYDYDQTEQSSGAALADGKLASADKIEEYDSDVTVSERTEGTVTTKVETSVSVQKFITAAVEITADAPDKYLMHTAEYTSMIDAPFKFEPVEGLRFNDVASEPFAVRERDVIVAYTKLIYDVLVIEEPYYNEIFDCEMLRPKDQNERQLTVKYCTLTADGWNQAIWEDMIIIVDDIDNTPPDVKSTVTPSIEQDMNGTPLYYTLGNVTADILVSDPHTGLGMINLYTYKYGDDDFSFTYKFPELSADGAIDPVHYLDGETLLLYEAENEYLKMSVYSVSDSPYTARIEITVYKNVTAALIFTNSCGDETDFMVGEGLEGLDVANIYKKDLSAADYKLSYQYMDANGGWQTLPDDPAAAAGIYYKTAKAVITATDEGVARGLYVSGGSAERLFDSFDNSYTFTLADKYGYTLEVPAGLNGFDVTPGSVGYTLSTSDKTNKDITVTISAADTQSGVGSVSLTCGGNAVILTGSGGIYTGKISANGSYVITMLDRAGNRRLKSFTVTNIDKTLPTVTEMIYSFPQEDGHLTSGDISVSLKFSKPNVTIVNFEVVSAEAYPFTVDFVNSVFGFTNNMSLTVWFEDEYGNKNTAVVTVRNIYKLPPALEALAEVSADRRAAVVKFAMAVDSSTGAPIDPMRKLSDLTVSYGGILQRADSASYTFSENGTYTFRVYDDDGITTYLTVAIADIDKSAPKITQIRWSYEYDLREADGSWTEKLTQEGSFDVGSEAGYIVATDLYPVTNQDVTVTAVSDSQTTVLGTGGAYGTEHTVRYDKNGMYIFNLEKANGLTASYGVGIEVIDKTPPVIVLDAPEIVFFENPAANPKPYDRNMIDKAFEAYDMFGGKVDLTDRVVIDYGGFNPSDLSANTFDRAAPYTITYAVYDDAHNRTEARMTVRLVSYLDSIVLINDIYPDYAGRVEINTDVISIDLKNFSGVSYARLVRGIRTMGEMKKAGTVLTETSQGSYEYKADSNGWYTILVQTDKRDYFLIQVYVYQ